MADCGRRIVEMVWEDLTPAKLLTRKNFENAITVAMAMGCSTNAIIHLVAMSRRAGPLRRERWTTSTPTRARCPSSPTSGPAATPT
jgi:dihydroxyacid dehydratase/phosphogluconate dehydratase